MRAVKVKRFRKETRRFWKAYLKDLQVASFRTRLRYAWSIMRKAVPDMPIKLEKGHD